MLATRIAYWMSLSVLIWVFFGYPLLILALGRYRRDDSRPSLEISELPHVSVLICAHNEERVIEGKIRNSLGLEYPFDKLNIIVVSDGSSDGTNEIAKRFSDRRLTLIAYAKRGGKATAINVGIQFASGDIIVFTDANVLLEPSALRQLVGAFKDFRVCGVVGNVILRAGDGSGDGEGIYSRYEKAIHAAEGNLCTMITVDGALYSLRRKYVGPIPVDTINDDWFLATGALLEGERIVFEPTAIGYEDAAETVAMEFARKVRMVAGGYQTTFRRAKLLLNPIRFPCVSFMFVSHKLLRWLAIVFMLTVFLCNIPLVDSSWWHKLTMVTQIIFYALAVMGLAVNGRFQLKLVYLPYYFMAVNWGALLGLWRYLRGRQSAAWTKSRA